MLILTNHWGLLKADKRLDMRTFSRITKVTLATSLLLNTPKSNHSRYVQPRSASIQYLAEEADVSTYDSA